MEEDKKIDENLDKIMENIEKAAMRSGRTLADINVISVTKTIDVERMKYVFQKGFNHFGENRVQELIEKYNQFNNEVRWHLIGHLQRNKVKDIIDKVELIHSVDSMRLVKELDLQASKINKKMPILIQVNVAEEQSKFGIGVEEVEDYIKEISSYKHIIVKGLMTIAPFEENIELTRPIFRELKGIYDRIKRKERDNINMEYLSMGMTNDYIVAIEEGSNMVRIGSGIFGKRNL